MQTGVIEGNAYVVVPTDSKSSGDSPPSTTRMRQPSSVLVPRTGWYICHAWKLSSGKLIHHQALECICDGIQVIQPSEKYYHILDGDRKSGVDTQQQDQHRRGRHGL